ncbi:MAG: threonine synthase [Coriobacteriales bacterium]|jgi:threonine synthase|nr:threonine synthase [Coriobacteriales bacterium]
MSDPRQFINTYTDTRGLSPESPTFTQALIKGMATGGGLFVPRVLPRLSLDEVVGLAQLPYAARAASIYRRFGVDLPSTTIDSLMAQAYGDNFDTPQIAPVVEVAPATYVLELWHGPTSAFKDMALQCLPLFFSAAIEAQQARLSTRPTNDDSAEGEQAADDYLVVVATSGDTGKAALEGFRDLPHTNIVVFYPHGGVSDIQFRQMATQQGNNVGVFGVEGNFDDCQGAVKAAFCDGAFNERLARERRLRLSSANSINWGRLLPQIVYYASAYTELVQRGALRAGEELEVCVPTGNFGNILAAWYAKALGVPLGRLLCASNENRVLTDFLNTGSYDIRTRDFKLTPSPSMDILISSNLERQLFEVSGRDTERICSWMDNLRETRCFSVDKETFAALREDFSADWVSNDDSLATIREVRDEHGYLLDPHSAVAWKVASRLRDGGPVLVVATAHWSKFGADVYRALNKIAAGEPLPEKAASLSGPALLKLLAADYDAGAIPAALSALEDAPLRFTQICPGTVEGVEGALDDWLSLR